MTRVIFSAIVIFAEFPLALGIVPFNLGIYPSKTYIFYLIQLDKEISIDGKWLKAILFFYAIDIAIKDTINNID